VGRSTNYDVLQRIDELSNAESSALSARIEYLKARAQLQALTGEILPAYGLKLQSAPQRG
jgi:outer membrane protein TolC